MKELRDDELAQVNGGTTGLVSCNSINAHKNLQERASLCNQNKTNCRWNTKDHECESL